MSDFLLEESLWLNQCKHCVFMQERIKLKPVELKRAAVLLSLCLYAPMTRWSFAVFGCRQLRQFEQEARLNVDLGAVCWDGLHYVAAVTAIIVLLGFGIGLPKK